MTSGGRDEGLVAREVDYGFPLQEEGSLLPLELLLVSLALVEGGSFAVFSICANKVNRGDL